MHTDGYEAWNFVSKPILVGSIVGYACDLRGYRNDKSELEIIKFRIMDRGYFILFLTL